MTRIAWHRPPRIQPPTLPEGRVSLAAPPQITPNQALSTWLTLLLPLLSSISMAAFMMTYHQTMLTLLGIGVVVISVGLTIGIRVQLRSASRRNKERQLTRYLEYLTEVKHSTREVAAAQRSVSALRHPSPQRLWAIAERGRRTWERRPSDPDFLELRVGQGRGPLTTPLQLSTRADPTVEYDPDSLAVARRLVERQATVGRQPALVHLGRAGVVSLLGPPDQARGLARALLLQLAVLHAPEDVTLAVCASGHEEQWRWTTWLPHTRDEPADPGLEAPPAPPAPLVAADFDGLADVVERELARTAEQADRFARGLGGARNAVPDHRLVLVIDDYDPGSAWSRSALSRKLFEQAGPGTGITVITLAEQERSEPSRVDVRVRVDAEGFIELEGRDASSRGAVESGVADLPEIALCEAAARSMAPLVLTDQEEQVLSRTVPLGEMLGVADLSAFDPTRHWLAPGDEDVLCVPLGVGADGRDVTLDLKEAAQEGMGPHGLVVGATGSGKSELLRTLVSGLTMTHPPELLSMVLVDFKGGATFAGLTDLPHVAGLITNLSDDQALVDRVRDALVGEQQRRQKLLRSADNVDSLRDYQLRRAAGGTDTEGRPLEPLPYLLVIVDEFGELLAGRPDFINLFVQIGRVGRSLGIHLLLATQRLDEGRLRGLESHLSYRLCLRTFSAAESRAVLGNTDAYKLPPIPGSAYLKVDETVYTRFRVAHVSAPYEADEGEQDDPAAQGLVPMPLALRAPVDLVDAAADERRGRRRGPSAALPVAARPRKVLTAPTAPTQMRVIVERLRRFGQPVHQVWLPPLPPAIPLDALVGPVASQPGRGLQATMWPFQGELRFPTGVIDVPLSQEQQPLVLDLGRKHPHLALVGAPQSGKSTFLRTAMLSAMLTHTPDELQFTCIDYGGGSLHAFGSAPHVAGVAGRHEPDRARRVLSEARRLVDDRERLFQEQGIGSVARFRQLRAQGALTPGTRSADLVVVIDNWGAVRGEIEQAEALALDIAGRGPGVGVHLIVAANRWGDIRISLRDAISARLELRLNDSAESEVDRRVAKVVPVGLPGRGAVAPGHLFHTLLPRLDGRDTVEDLGDAQEGVLAKIGAGWSGPVAPRVKMLPERIYVRDLMRDAAPDAAAPGAAQDEGGALIGVGERDLEPVRLDLLTGDRHCIVIGDAGAGKSAFLRTWMRGLAAKHSPWEARFMVVDYRRALMDVVPAEYIGAYASDANAAASYCAQLAQVLADRLPRPDITARELRERAWWQGPELYLVLDDYDLVAGQRATPMQPLVDYVAQSRDIGFHVVLARRSGGMARAMTSDPLLSRVREIGADGLLLSADPREGVLLGNRRGAELPPGRGMLLTRRSGQSLVQIALSDEEDESDDPDARGAAGSSARTDY